MNTNASVIDSFLKHEENCAGHLMSTGKRLISYQTTIAQWYEGYLIVNMTKYSQTTSKHRGILLRKCSSRMNLIPVEDVVLREDNLAHYLK